MANYFAVFMPVKEGGYSVEFPDIPEAFTQGDNFEECVLVGEDVLSIAVEEYAKARKDLPPPSSLEQVEKWAEEQKNDPDTDSSRRHFIQLFRAPKVDTTPVRVSVSFAKSVLEEIDVKAAKHGMTRSGFIAKATQAYPSH